MEIVRYSQSYSASAAHVIKLNLWHLFSYSNSCKVAHEANHTLTAPKAEGTSLDIKLTNKTVKIPSSSAKLVKRTIFCTEGGDLSDVSKALRSGNSRKKQVSMHRLFQPCQKSTVLRNKNCHTAQLAYVTSHPLHAGCGLLLVLHRSRSTAGALSTAAFPKEVSLSGWAMFYSQSSETRLSQTGDEICFGIKRGE